MLGPLEVAGPDGRVRIGGAKERLVLALLALRAGEVVSRDALVDALWGDDPPATAVKTLQGYVARVRRALEAAGHGRGPGDSRAGLRAACPADSIDVAGFERHATAGRGALADGDASRATAELGDALGLWRGDALADCRGGGWAAAEAVRLDELRLSTVEDRIDADLMLGHHGVLVGELESLVARHPLRERLWAALMLALYRAGRQADAVRAYQRARDVLVEELGLEPGAELRRLEAAVLAGDPALRCAGARRRGERRAHDSASRSGSQRRSSAVFVGRADERERLNRSLKAVAAGERRVVLVSGEPGIGKTSLSAAFARDAFDERRGRVVRALRRGPRDPVPAVGRGARPPRRSRTRRRARRARRRAGQRAGAARAGSRSPRDDRARFVERRRVGAVSAVRRGRRPPGAGLGVDAGRARAR